MEMDEAYFNLAVCQYMQGNFNEAYQNIGHALKIHSENSTYGEMSTKLKEKLSI
jgi:TolA-binding protein